MCARYAITLPPAAVRTWFAYDERPDFPPRFNIAPTQPIPIVCRDDTRIGPTARHFRLVRWGFVPSWVKDWGRFPPLFNARAEAIAEKPSFRAALMRRRCLVIADGYYAWRRTAARGPGTPFLFRRRDGNPMGFAGLHERWMGADGTEIETACIITTPANGAGAAVHPRMPAILARDHYERWLDADGLPPDRAVALLRPAAEDALDLFEVGPAVNAVANDDPTLWQPVSRIGSTPERRQGQLF